MILKIKDKDENWWLYDGIVWVTISSKREMKAHSFDSGDTCTFFEPYETRNGKFLARHVMIKTENGDIRNFEIAVDAWILNDNGKVITAI